MVLGRGGWPCAGSGLAGAGGVAAGAGGVACFQVGAGCFPRPPIVPRSPSGVKALRPLQGGPCGPGLDPGRCPPGIGSDQGKGGRRLNGACRSRAVACGLSNSRAGRRERHAEFKAMGADAGCRKRHRDRGDQLEENPGPDGEPEITVIARVRPHRRRAGRCGICGRRCPGYDQGERRRWRALDLGAIRAELEGAAPRVSCPGHSVTVAAVPWARHGARHTRAFEDTIAWGGAAPRCSRCARR